eukprot:CAMPEP_0113589426 /NCGR_PEP_ID=MMETSP0015_2-20120614/36078_1 /TAXON_ID=2838 /ORGANISM="Odontella" /LENGTH=38 /DNA_ID=CAMNT_0000495437 /DNA_START=37 /DNA_END=150 /DNA_ORIENTATION=+ /assembly_acc=CAM_ASM_000160
MTNSSNDAARAASSSSSNPGGYGSRSYGDRSRSWRDAG